MCDKDLISHLWEKDSLLNSKNNLKNAVLRLKKDLLAIANFDTEPIIRENGGYMLSSEFEIEIDYLKFKSLCDELYNGKKKSQGQLISIYNQILDVYQGDFMCPAESRWARDAVVNSAVQFLEAIADYCSLLWDNEKYMEILDVYIKVSKARTPCDELMLYRFRAMSMLAMNRGIVGFYPEARGILEERAAPGSPALIELHEIAQQAQLSNKRSLP